MIYIIRILYIYNIIYIYIYIYKLLALRLEYIIYKIICSSLKANNIVFGAILYYIFSVFPYIQLALRLEGLRLENFENLENMSSRNKEMQFRLN